MTPEEALIVPDRFAGTELAADGLCVAGYALGYTNTDEATNGDRGRERLERAYVMYRAQSNRTGASHAARLLAKVPPADAVLEYPLTWARIAVDDAEASGDALALGQAEGELAEAYDELGMVDDASVLFVNAEGRLLPWPDKLAHTVLKHGIFLLDSDRAADLPTAIAYFNDAEALAKTANDATLVVAAHLNRAAALALLGRFDEASAELALEEHDPMGRCKIDLVSGYIAARKDQLGAAEAHFFLARECTGDGDYRWRLAFELGELHRRAGRVDAAERAYRAAIEAVEALREESGGVVVRPRVLAHRTHAYRALLRLYAEQGRGLEALVVAESLHARGWLDSVLGASLTEPRMTKDVIDDLTIRRLATAEPAFGREALLAHIGGREAVIIVSDGDALWRAHVRRGSVTFTRLAPDAAAVIQAFSEAPGDLSRAYRAGELLIPADLATSDEPLYIVANGELADVPFAALRHDGHPLVEARPVSRLHGLVALVCREGQWTDRRVFVGNAGKDLPQAEAEVRRLAGADAHVGDDATVAVIGDARDAAVLHVAVHGATTQAGGALVLADGTLTAAAVILDRIAPRLVILTGCVTAGSNDAETWDGLPSAFLAAGARNVVATLRSVEDRDAAAFSAAFYATPDALDPVRRLATAQRAMIAANQPVTAWASFAVWGVADCAAAPSTP